MGRGCGERQKVALAIDQRGAQVRSTQIEGKGNLGH
jgi:hypothetical protein